MKQRGQVLTCPKNIHKEKIMIIDVGYWTRILKNVLMLVISLVLIFLAFKLAVFYMPFLIGFIISLMIEPLIRLLARKTTISRKKCAVIVLIIICVVLLGLLSWGIFSLITESTNLLQGFNTQIEMMYNQVKNYIAALRDENTKLPAEIVEIIENSTDKVISFITEYISNFLTKVTQTISQLPVIAIYVFITILATYFICTDKLYILDTIEHQIPTRWARKIGIQSNNIIKSLGNYLKAEVILITISFFIVLVGLYIFKIVGMNISYPFLTALRDCICRCTSNTRFRNSNDTMGSNISIKWGLNFRHSNYSIICSNTSSKTISRTKNSKQQNRNTPNIHAYCNVYRI